MSMEDLEISLYTTGASDDELCGVSSILSQGRLSFSLVHDIRNDCLIVNLHKAAALKVASSGKVNVQCMAESSILETYSYQEEGD